MFHNENSERNEIYPKIWPWYVKDIFTLFDTEKSKNKEQLLFQDDLVKINCSNKFAFDLLRKDIPNYLLDTSENKIESSAKSGNYEINCNWKYRGKKSKNK